MVFNLFHFLPEYTCLVNLFYSFVVIKLTIRFSITKLNDSREVSSYEYIPLYIYIADFRFYSS